MNCRAEPSPSTLLARDRHTGLPGMEGSAAKKENSLNTTLQTLLPASHLGHTLTFPTAPLAPTPWLDTHAPFRGAASPVPGAGRVAAAGLRARGEAAAAVSGPCGRHRDPSGGNVKAIHVNQTMKKKTKSCPGCIKLQTAGLSN